MKNETLKLFKRWLKLYTNGTFRDYKKLPYPRRSKIMEMFMNSLDGPWGSPCGGLINIKEAKPCS